MQLEPKNIAVFEARGNLRLQQKKWPEAVSDFSRVISTREDIAQAYLGRGRGYVEMGQIEVGLVDLDRALTINAGVPTGYFWRGQAYRRKGDTD
ncbi:MAG: hypothetical protein KKI02_10005, partial [Planctomycetes bacterium]|nr:hypothetical protein [Planctomycetota bacterium]